MFLQLNHQKLEVYTATRRFVSECYKVSKIFHRKSYPYALAEGCWSYARCGLLTRELHSSGSRKGVLRVTPTSLRSPRGAGRDLNVHEDRAPKNPATVLRPTVGAWRVGTVSGTEESRHGRGQQKKNIL
jgi:hypothetical protein